MFFLKPRKSVEEHAALSGLRSDGYPNLDRAIQAALDAGMDLDMAVIEKRNVAEASVNDWIAVRLAGGDLGAG